LLCLPLLEELIWPVSFLFCDETAIELSLQPMPRLLFMLLLALDLTFFLASRTLISSKLHSDSSKSGFSRGFTSRYCNFQRDDYLTCSLFFLSSRRTSLCLATISRFSSSFTCYAIAAWDPAASPCFSLLLSFVSLIFTIDEPRVEAARARSTYSARTVPPC